MPRAVSVPPHWPLIAGLFSAYDELALAAFGRTAAEGKHDGTTVTALDRAASRLCLERLRRETPAYGVISEEEDTPHQLDAEWIWVVDPVDGTASFARGYPAWGLGIGLLRGAEPVAGYLRFPALRETLTCADGRITWNGESYTPRRQASLADTRNALIGATLHGEVPYGKLTGLKLRNYGSNLYHMACLALGRADVMLSPRCYLWDYAAGLPFTRAAGMIEVYADGSPFSVTDLLRPGAGFRSAAPLVIGPPEEVERLLAQLR
jgi:fructose-1,6-bisphosphatase/inositol monophosphatase family enzyme